MSGEDDQVAEVHLAVGVEVAVAPDGVGLVVVARQDHEIGEVHLSVAVGVAGQEGHAVQADVVDLLRRERLVEDEHVVDYPAKRVVKLGVTPDGEK